MSIELLERHTPTGDLVLEWARMGKYRIVKLDLPPAPIDPHPLAWHIVRVGWFGFVYGVSGYDKGAPGEYNHQLISAGNPIALLDTLAEIARQKLTPVKVAYWGRDSLPTHRIVDEIDIAATIRALIKYHHQCPHRMPPIQDLYQCMQRPLKTKAPTATRS